MKLTNALPKGLFILAAGCAGVVIPLMTETSTAAMPGRGDGAFTVWGAFHNPDGSGDLVYLSGQRVQANGRASFAGCYGEGATVGSFGGIGLADADLSVVALILRFHGPANEAFLDEQLSSIDGGCAEYNCQDRQYCVFIPDGNSYQTSAVYSALTDKPIPNARASLWRDETGIRYAIHTDLRRD